MKLKILISSVLCFMFLFFCVGYASPTDSLEVEGSATAKAVEGLFITNVAEISTSNIDRNDFSYVGGTTNVINHISRGEDGGDGTVVYEVTVYNNTNFTYYYRDIYYQTGLSEYNGNDYIN